jgi:hypothetical protein
VDELQGAVVAVERLNDILEKEPEFKPRETSKVRSHVCAATSSSAPPLSATRRRHQRGPEREPDHPGGRRSLVGAAAQIQLTADAALQTDQQPVLIDGFDVAEVSLPDCAHRSPWCRSAAPSIGIARENIAPPAGRHHGAGDAAKAAAPG